MNINGKSMHIYKIGLKLCRLKALSKNCSIRPLCSLTNWKTLTDDYLSKDIVTEESIKRIVLHPIVKESAKIVNKDEYAITSTKIYGYMMMISYSGEGYLGMQINANATSKDGDVSVKSTIEQHLLQAMVNASILNKIVLWRPQIYKYQRASRTDRNVSAVRQYVSFTLDEYIQPETVPDLINAYLPETIKVMNVDRVKKDFNVKVQCDSRTYSYMCPTYAFASITEVIDKSYRISEQKLEELRSILSVFKGTHRFHNFTAKVKYEENKAFRYIRNISCSEPFIRDDIEWTIITMNGDSFMLHQIRKMIGLSIAICKNVRTFDVLNNVWDEEKCDIPKAPALGLFLEKPHFDNYQAKSEKGYIKWLINCDPSVEDKVAAFKEKYILPVIVKGELQDQVMLRWLSTLLFHNYDLPIDPADQNVKFENRSGVYRALRMLKEHCIDAESETLSDSVKMSID